MGAEAWAQETFDDVMASEYGSGAVLAHKLRRALGNTPPSAVVVVSDELPTGEMLAQHRGRDRRRDPLRRCRGSVHRLAGVWHA